MTIPLRKCPFAYVLSVVAVMLCMATSAADVDVGDGANDNTYTDSTTYAGATKIVKTGTGKTTLSFGNNTPSFNKEIEVREGTLAVARYPQNFGSPTKITVSSGATLDLTWSENALGKLNKAEIVIAGTGVNDAGAIRRTSGYTLNALFGTITLAADALIKHTPQCGFSDNVGIVNLNGHTLSVHAGSSVFYCPGTQFKDNGAATSGGLTILSGTFFPRFSVSENTEDNVLTLKDGTTLRFRDLNTKPKWKIVTEGTVTFTADSVGNNPETSKTWAGPVEQGGQITLYPNALNTFFTIAGNISNKYDIVMDSNSKGQTTLSGSNDVNAVTASGGTLRIDGGKTVVHGAISVTYGGSLIVTNAVLFADYAKMTAVTIGHSSNTPKFVVEKDSEFVSNDFGGDDGAAARLYVGRYAGQYGTMEVHDGSIVSNVLINIGEEGNGALYQTGGKIYWPPRSGDIVARAENAYGYYGIGGDFTMDARNFSSSAGVVMLARTGTVVIVVRDGGSFNVKKSNKVSFAVEEPSHVLLYQNSGTKSSFDDDFMFSTSKSSAGHVEVTIAGDGSELEVDDEFKLQTTNTSAHAFVNINDGGTLAARYMYRTASDYDFYFNINGGVIKPRRSSAIFSGGVNDAAHRPTRSTVYEKGFVIDTSDTMNGDRTVYDTASMHLSFAAPPDEGLRVKSIALPTDAGFSSEKLIGPPMVTITGDGEGASAFALFDDVNHTLTNIVVTSPGWGYTEATATLSAGGLANVYTCAVTLEPQPTDGWQGFTKRGAQRLNMHGRLNAFKGDVTVEEGILGFMNEDAEQGGMPEGAGAIIKEGAMLTFPKGSTPVTVPFLAGCGTTTLADGVKIVVTDPENLAQYRRSGSAVVVNVLNGLTCQGTVTLDFGDGGEEDVAQWNVSVKSKSLTLGFLNGTTILFR